MKKKMTVNRYKKYISREMARERGREIGKQGGLY